METTFIEDSFDFISSKTNILAYLFLAIGLIGLGGFFYYRNPFALMFPLAGFFGAAYFLIYKRVYQKSISISFLDLSSRKVLLLICLYISLALLTFLTYHRSGFNRTLLVHLFTLSLYLISCVFIFSNISYKYSLSLIILTGFVHRILMYYSSPTYIGVDVHGHNQLVGAIIEEGSLLPSLLESKYYFAPFYHIYSAVGSIILSASVRHTMLLVIFNLVLIPALFIFLIVRRLWDIKMGLIAGLFYIASDFVLSWSLNLGPTSLGVLLSVIVFFILFKYLDKKSIRYYFILLLFFVVLTYTHQVSTFITFIAITTYLAFFSIFDYSESLRRNIVILITMPLIVFLDFIRTAYSGVAGDISFFDRIVQGIAESFEEAGPGTRVELTLPPDVSSGVTASLTPIHIAGSAILIGLSVIGLLYILKSDSKRTTKVKFSSIFVTGFVLIAITLAGPMIGMRNLMPYRWFAFFYIFLIIVGVIGLLPIIKNLEQFTRKDIAVLLVIFLIIVPYFGIMGANYRGAMDNPVFDSAPGATRHSIHDGEDALFWHTSDNTSEEKIILADERLRSALRDHYGLKTRRIQMEYENPNSIPERYIEEVLLINRRTLNTPQNMYTLRYEERTVGVYGPIDIEEIDPEMRQTIYDNGQDELLLLKPRER